MNTLIRVIIFILIIAQAALAQAPLVKMWDKRFGGNKDDALFSLQQTSDDGYILGGSSGSGISGDKTQSSWGPPDYWVVKVNSVGNKQWDKRFGGDVGDVLYSLQQTSDGGYILGGSSTSGISGDKTQSRWGSSIYVSTDYWAIKIDSLGNKQWDKRFWGTENDNLFSVQQTTDGGYILGGYSQSGVGGDKTQANWSVSYSNFWLVKIDSLGNKKWDKRFGGTDGDFLYSLQQTTDGGYILGGYSYSGISGDKTQSSWGGTDYWVIKIDSLANKQWDKRFGGTKNDELHSVRQTTDGGYILGGFSNSDISGDKTQDVWGISGWPDYWIVKTDPLGNKQWDKRFGGTHSEDEFGNISQTADGGYLIAGTSYSGIGGDKTENNLGWEQTWVVKTDSLGAKQWDKTFLTNSSSAFHDEQGLAIETTDRCYAIANYTIGGIGGDKTQPNWDTTNTSVDYWLIKFCDTTFTNCNLSLSGPDTVTISQQATYTASAASDYLWRVTNGVIMSGQGTSSVVIKWEPGRLGTVQVTVPGCPPITKYVTITKRRATSPVTYPIHWPWIH